jgi:RNA polymerase sigma-70 factor (ECF subfamily)
MVEATLQRESGSVAQQAFMRLADRHLHRAYRMAGLILGNQHDAEDATQDALVRAWSASAALNSWDDFQAWFDRILVNVCRDRLRRRRIIRFIPMASEHDRPSADEFQQVIAGDELLRAMSGLDVDLRTVIVLRYWADLQVHEIATRVGVPDGTVKSRINRALAQMRSTIGEASTSREEGSR